MTRTASDNSCVSLSRWPFFLSAHAKPRSRRNYKFAMEQFVAWYCSEPRLALNRSVVLRFRLHLESLGLAAGTINQRLAAVRRLAAKHYSQIAPDSPHALHMPSHIFTRLGLWDDSIASNLASADSARKQKLAGDELHALDYQVRRRCFRPGGRTAARRGAALP